ncbi:hypothetical protein KEM54_000442 [Ascosphaera aggregata]|nr:hypothetical protein KEM54_000442 [Ascosphaera aggregata]
MVDDFRGPPPRPMSRKRRYRDDEDYDRQRRRRFEEPMQVTARKMLIGIAESAVRRVEDDVYQVAKIIADHSDEEEIKDLYTRLAVQLDTDKIHTKTSTLEQPLKIPFIASVILTLNILKPETVSEFLQHAKNTTQSYIERGLWREVKLLFRLLGCLQSLFEGDGIFSLLETLFSRSVDLQTASSEDSLGLELVKTILFTIPYVMSSSAEGLESYAAALLDKTDIIASTPHTLEALVSPFPTEDDTDAPRLSIIGLLQKQLQEEAKNGWDLYCLPRPWIIATARIESERARKREERQRDDENRDTERQDDAADDELEPSPATARKHAFPRISVPDPVPNGPRAIFPEVYFSVYLEQDIETVPPLTDVASCLIRDVLIDTINVLDSNRIVAAKALIDVDCYFTPRTFMKRAVPYDKLREVVSESDSSTWKPEDAAVDAVFSQLFQLPTPEHKFVYYHSVLTESCKLAPAAVAPSLGRAIRYLYRSSPRMDLALSYRFLDWFAHHLSNFGFTWKWTEWIDDLELPDVHPKKAFIIGAIDKEIRLSFAQRIKGTLPMPYRYLITEGKESDIPDFKYNDDATPYATEGKELMQLIRKKAPDSDIAPVIRSIEQQAQDHGVSEPMIQSTDAFVTAICYVGSKSLSHVLSCIERNKERLLTIGPNSSAARRQIITSVLEYWADQPGIGVNIIDKLLNYTVLTPLSVIEWALVDKLNGGYALTQPHIYEMVNSTMGKVATRIRQIVAARTQSALFEPQLTVIHETLQREQADMEAMFRIIFDTAVAVANGNNDDMLERRDGDDTLTSEDELVKVWGERWARVFKRKMAVEQAFVSEAMKSANPVGTTAPVPPTENIYDALNQVPMSDE